MTFFEINKSTKEKRKMIFSIFKNMGCQPFSVILNSDNHFQFYII